MKSKKSQNIQIAEILSYYTPNNLRKYSPQALNQQLNDLRVLYTFTGHEVPKICSDLRKKMNEVQKLVTEIASSAALMESEFLNKPAANHELAYKILSMSASSLITIRPIPKVINQLKLKFLESINVSIEEWHFHFRSESCTLAISIPQQKASIVIGVRQKQLKNEMDWAIIQAYLGIERSPQLFSFFFVFWEWSVKNNTNYSVTLIDDIKKLLKNLPLIKIFLQLRKIWKSYEQIDAIKYTTKTKYNQFITVSWKFDFFTSLGSPKITIEINSKKMIDLLICPNQLRGSLILAFTEHSQPITLVLKHQKLPLLHEFVSLPQNIYNFDRSLCNFLTKNQFFSGKDDYKLIVSTLGGNWLPQDLNSKDFEQIQPQGIWIYLPIESGVMLYIQQEGILSNKNRDRALASLLASKNIGLWDLGRHLILQELIFADNSSYQLKFYEYKIEGKGAETFIQYQFRSLRYSMNQRYSRLTRVQENYINQDIFMNENYLIKIKIALDFTKIQFLVNKFQDGRRIIERQDEDAEKYIKKDWKHYKEHLQIGAKLSWTKVAEAIGYMCRCMASQRLKLRRLNSNQRGNTHLDLN